MRKNLRYLLPLPAAQRELTWARAVAAASSSNIWSSLIVEAALRGYEEACVAPHHYLEKWLQATRRGFSESISFRQDARVERMMSWLNAAHEGRQSQALGILIWLGLQQFQAVTAMPYPDLTGATRAMHTTAPPDSMPSRRVSLTVLSAPDQHTEQRGDTEGDSESEDDIVRTIFEDLGEQDGF